MNTLSNLTKDRLNHQQLQKGNHFIRSSNNKQKRQKQTILFLLHQERLFECQNNREMINNCILTKDRKNSSERLKFRSSIKQSPYENAVTLTPKFKKHNLSESKLPPLKKRGKRQINLQVETIAPWEQEESYNLIRPLSSKLLPY